MTTIARTQVPTNNRLIRREQWLGMAQNDDGQVLELAVYTDRSVQVSGTFGGATVLLEGSNDGVTWATLTDPTSAPLSFAAAGLKQISEIACYARARIDGGNGTTDINVNLCLKEPA
jgi:hypothetical protein